MVIVQREKFDTGAEFNRLTEGRTDIGAVVTFTGLVRDFNDGSNVTSLTLEHYPGMTEKELEKIEAAARERWALTECLIIHRFGKMDLGEPIVLVITASAHRGDAFAAAEFLMDWLKTKAPFWKLEANSEGENDWVKERESDHDAAKRWQ
ncbi:molybdopterin synthase catalytic subunit MoaE [Sneathiella chinensis]|uniref:Molybdopterin synthase catalytic subunit n=1 Tax=Sneathiella chinensis TaxID=349750 RepID=A0ABQ5U4R7_9PROT|nr:molybdopterin synthase catalytic subunit MoaE [Sneathiella chinensis]GLQ06243.1 molybdopterin guanine dinucleotide biosynthesis protein MoaE [Sneathiella chinensis]